jgi:WS/DGAT/MGAT family acyltransferase
LRRLSGLDASFLALDGPSSSGHICLVATLDRPVSPADLRATLVARLPSLPVLRQRLVPIPFGLDRPYWALDPDFDLDRHLSETIVEPSAEALGRAVATIAESRLPRDRPLWEIHLLSGAVNALVTKIHHALVDGVAGRELLSTLLDETPVRPAAVDDTPPQPIPGQLEMLARGLFGLADVPATVLRLEGLVAARLPELALWPAEHASAQTIEWLTSGTEPDPPRVPRGTVAPATPFNRAITPRRSWAGTTLSVDASKATRKNFGATVNDIVLAATAGALRRWLLERDALPAEPLRALVPVSVRAGGETQDGNHIALMTCALPTDLAEPEKRLRAVRQATLAAKARHALSARTLQDLSRIAVPALATRASGLIARTRLASRVRLPINLVISNVPGPEQPYRVGGALVEGLYPVPALSDGLGVTITVQGYRRLLHVGITACPDLVPDVESLAHHIETAHEEMVTLG